MAMFIVIIIQLDIKLVVVDDFAGIVNNDKLQSFLIGVEILRIEFFSG